MQLHGMTTCKLIWVMKFSFQNVYTRHVYIMKRIVVKTLKSNAEIKSCVLQVFLICILAEYCVIAMLGHSGYLGRKYNSSHVSGQIT